MKSSEMYPNWRKKFFLVSAFTHNSTELLERHMLLQNDAKLKLQPEFIQNESGVHTKIELKFPVIDFLVKNKVSDTEPMFSELNNRPTAMSTRVKNVDDPPDIPEHESAKEQRGFYSARELITIASMKKNDPVNVFGNQQTNVSKKQYGSDFNFSATRKSLGRIGRLGNATTKRFVSPISNSSPNSKQSEAKTDPEMEQLLTHPNLKNIDPKMVEMISSEIIHKYKSVDWNEIAGLHYAKSIIKEAVVYPLLRPDIYTGLRRPPRGILLFGPPGTGKTLIGKCIASQSSATFFSISSASLTSKWMGEGEKMVRALFAVAQALQPAVIFIDEVDSLLSQRSETENEGTRRLKTEFLVRLDGAATTDDDRVLIVGATNRPQELDEAVRRRFVKRLYVPLPEIDARFDILTNLLKSVDNNLDTNDIKEISLLTEGYSGADMDSLCREASMEPLRSLPVDTIMTFNKDKLRPVCKEDFQKAIRKIRPSVSQKHLDLYVDWNKTYGSSF